MTVFMNWFENLLSIILVTFSSLATTFVYDSDGEHTNIRVAHTDMCGGAFNLAAGAKSGPHGWIDMSKCGKPFISCILTTYASSGVRDVAVSVDYGERLGNDIIITTTQKQRSTDALDYGPKRGIMKMTLTRQFGSYTRIREVQNDSDCLVAVQTLSPSSMKPLRTITTVDNNVEVI